MFRKKKASNEFHFLQVTAEDPSTVRFHYSLGSSSADDFLPLSSCLILPVDLLSCGKTAADIIDSKQGKCYELILCIGMCKLLWFWMGFATPLIVLSSEICFPSRFLPFWQSFYSNILAEFSFVHRLSFLPSIQLPEDAPRVDGCTACDAQTQARPGSVLLPLGGGKDSLVALRLLQQQSKQPTMIYIADQPLEFENNSLLRSLVQEIQRESPEIDLILLKHDFHCDNFEMYSKSYLKPTGHPWAALVLFDSLLVSIEVISLFY